ncbi:reverse transcriptase domain-containing protein [Tunturiibacter gelidiferens]|uniref:reverse transcriptase domain-containing protein n=1 Tax=Tunturiibacter gelidiferens TaxID=3069689 RepID=UPI003D9B6395
MGAVASPLLANVYLHYVFDLWADVWRRKVASGDVIVVRYADDLVVGFQHRMDAERFLPEFQERLAKFGLDLHPDKTRLIEFGRFAARDRKLRGERKPETFTFLGFTHYCGQRHKSGTFTVGRITAKKRMVAKLKASRSSFNAGGMIAWPKSGDGFGRSCWATTNTMQFLGTRHSYASSSFACAGYGRVFWSAAASAQRCVGNVSLQS